MAPLEDVPVTELEAAMADVPRNEEVRRLLAAIVYKRGPSVPMIADWLDVREATVYRWFDRFEAEPPERAAKDRPRSGRPSKLSAEQLATFRAAVRRSPRESGFDRDEWTPALTKEYLQEAFDVDYSTRHVRRLLAEAEDDSLFR